MEIKKIQSFLKFYWISVITFLILTGISLYFFKASRDSEKKHKAEIFVRRTEAAKTEIERRLGHYIQILRGAKGLYNASEYVSREEWKNYFHDIEIMENYPGIQGIGYGKLIFLKELESHIQGVRKGGFHNYKVYPAGERNYYVIVQYLEPIEDENKEALGYDMYSEPVRRKAMDIAWQKDEASLSGKVTLIVETAIDSQPGFILFFPIYEQGAVPETPEKRFEKLKGFVYIPFRANDLINAILKEEFDDLDIEIFQGTERTENKKLYDKVPSIEYNEGKPGKFNKKHILSTANQIWSLYFTTMPGFGNTTSFSYGILAGGLTISFLVFFIMVFFSNIRKAQDEIVKSAEHTRFLTDSMPQIVWLSDSEGNITYINKRGIEYLGRPLYELINWQWIMLLHPDDVERTILKWKGMIQTGNDYQLEYRLKKHAGEYRWFLARALAQKDKNGKIILWVGTTTDIHDQKMQTEQLQKVNADLDNFIYTASHDLKAPVSNIEGLVFNLKDLLYDEEFNVEDSKEIIALMELSIERFQRTLRYLTEISKTQKNLAEDIEELTIGKIFEDLKADIKPLIEQNKAEIKTELLCGNLRFSRSNFRSIIYNLLTNAIKYRSLARNPVVEIKCYRTAEYFILEVKDNGLGIKSDQQEKIFQMFKRIHDHVEGTGVGLYLVKRIVDNNGGKIEVESTEGQGSTFRVYLKDNQDQVAAFT